MTSTKKTSELVEDALKLSAKWLGSSAAYEGHEPKSKSDIIQELRVQRLQKELAQAKQNVVRHLYHSRSIEAKLLQSNQVEENMKSHVKREAILKDTMGFQPVAANAGPEERRLLQTKELALVEASCRERPGVGSLIQDFAEEYSDESLRNELETIPPKFRTRMTALAFIKIALSASAQYVSTVEAGVIFGLACQKAGNTGKDKWDVLSQMLRKKLFRVHLGRELILKSITLEKTAAPKNYMRAGGEPGVPPPRIPSSGMFALSDSSSLPPHGHGHTYSDGGASLSITMKSPSSTSSKGFAQAAAKGKSSRDESLAKLQKQLRQAQNKQNGHQDSIISNLSVLSQSIPLNETDHKSAWKFSKRMGARKLEKVLIMKSLRILQIAVQKWLRFTQLHRSEIACLSVIRHIATVRLTRYLDEIFNAKLKRGFRKFRSILKHSEDIEKMSAVVEVQRIIRGKLGKLRVRNIRRFKASQSIQKIARARAGKAKVGTKRHEKALRHAVAVVEKYWKAQVWMRTLKRLRIQQVRHRMATVIASSYRGYRGRVNLRAAWLRYRRRKGAIKMQSLFRRYSATLYVDWYRENRRLIKASTIMQCAIRKLTAKVRVQDLREKNFYAGKITRFILIRLAIHKVKTWRFYVYSRRIQCLFRGNKARKRVNRLRNAKSNASIVIFKMVMGWYTCMVWIPVIKDHKFRRCNAANLIKMHFRGAIQMWKTRKWFNDTILFSIRRIQRGMQRKLARMHDMERKRAIAGRYWMRVQKRWRGILGRQRYSRIRKAWELAEAIRKQPPKYFLMKMQYYREQNMYHRPFVLKIQCAFRCIRAWRKVNSMKRNKAARKIQKVARDWLACKDAQRECKRRQIERKMRHEGAINIERVVRGFMGRYEARKHKHADLIKWFIHEAMATGMVGKALNLFRIRKKNLEHANIVAAKIQCIMRGILGRKWLRQNLKRLKRDKEKRRQLKRHKAAIEIQCMGRVWFARKKFAIKVLEDEEIKKETAVLEELENNLEQMHTDHLDDLMAARVQSGARKALAQTTYAQKKEAARQSVIRKEQERLFNSAQKIQALARGVNGRHKFKGDLPRLKRAQQTRKFCVECESAIAIKRCRVCMDRYCGACFEKIHKKGKRMKHGWDPIKDERERQIKEKPAVVLTASASKGPVWEEYFDDSAGAKYWYNVATGEARWTDPNPKTKM